MIGCFIKKLIKVQLVYLVYLIEKCWKIFESRIFPAYGSNLNLFAAQRFYPIGAA